jgi:hypothetical protein
MQGVARAHLIRQGLLASLKPIRHACAELIDCGACKRKRIFCTPHSPLLAVRAFIHSLLDTVLHTKHAAVSVDSDGLPGSGLPHGSSEASGQGDEQMPRGRQRTRSGDWKSSGCRYSAAIALSPPSW